MLVDSFINTIYLYDDKIVITFNYKEGTKTVTLDDANKAVTEGKSSDLDSSAVPTQHSAQEPGCLSFFVCMAQESPLTHFISYSPTIPSGANSGFFFVHGTRGSVLLDAGEGREQFYSISIYIIGGQYDKIKLNRGNGNEI